MPYSDNAQEVAAWYGQLAAGSGYHELTLVNVEEYATYLHNRHGYYVFNDQEALKAVLKWLTETVMARGVVDAASIELALDAAGYEIVNFLRTLTGKMKEPARGQDGERDTYPGGWADVTGNLANAYIHLVNGKNAVRHGDGAAQPG